MPSRLIRPVIRLLAFELPILPFLAPRVFATWPQPFQRGRAYGSDPVRTERDNNEDSRLQEILQEEKSTPRFHEQKSLSGRGVGTISHSGLKRDLLVEPTEDPSFQKSYMNTWEPTRSTPSATVVPLHRARRARLAAGFEERTLDTFSCKAKSTTRQLTAHNIQVPEYSSSRFVESPEGAPNAFPLQQQESPRLVFYQSRLPSEKGGIEDWGKLQKAIQPEIGSPRRPQFSGFKSIFRFEKYGQQGRGGVKWIRQKRQLIEAHRGEEISGRVGKLQRIKRLSSTSDPNNIKTDFKSKVNPIDKNASVEDGPQFRERGRLRRIRIAVRSQLKPFLKKRENIASSIKQRRLFILHTSHHYLRLRCGPGALLDANFNASWTRTFAAVHMEADFAIPVPSAGQYISKTSRAILELTCKDITKKWEAETRKEKVWPKVMIGLLRTDPHAALRFLVATCFPPYPPGYAISDSLMFIVSRYLEHEDGRSSENIESLLSIIIRLLDSIETDYFHLEQHTIHKLLQPLNGEQVKRFYDKLVQCNHPLERQTAAHFITAFARTKQTEMALEVIRWLQSMKLADFSQPVLESTCSTVLMQKHRSSSPNAPSDSEILGLMMRCGLQPNIITYNVLLHNSVQVGDTGTAQQIYQMMVENGISADHYTYSILFNAAKWRLDRDEIARLMSVITSSNMFNERIVTDILHAMFLMADEDRKAHFAKFNTSFHWHTNLNSQPPHPPFSRMLEFYSDHFDTGLLWKLIPAYPGMPAPDVSKWHPSTDVLVVMLIAFFREARSSEATAAVYNNFRKQVEERQPDVLLLSHSTFVYDAALMAFGKSKETLETCTVVISHMLSSHSNNHTHSAPSVITWSILLKSFMDHLQPLAAEKVLSMMRERGIKPNQVTWNSLMIGYARMQDITNVVKTIGRFEIEGWTLDEAGVRGLQWIQDRRTLLKALDKAKSTAETRVPGLRLADLVSENISLAMKVPLLRVNRGEEDGMEGKPFFEKVAPIRLEEMVFPSVGPELVSREVTKTEPVHVLGG